MFITLLANRAAHALDLDRLKPEAFLDAMVASFHGDERKLVSELRRLAK
jgi:cell filamentation protein